MPVGSMKNPVPDKSPCSSVPRILTTALPDFSKISFTSRLIDDACDSGDWAGGDAGVVSSAGAKLAKRAREIAKPKRTIIAGQPRRLESESRLITHWRTIQHVTRWRHDPVSFGALFDSAHE